MLLNKSDLWESFQKQIEELLSGLPVSVSAYVVFDMKGAPCWVWNELAKRAYADGCDYFFQLNDDIAFVHNNYVLNWPDLLIDALQKHSIPNLGMTADLV